MILSVHQPNFIPWLGFFYKLKLSDFFVFLDDVQFSKNSYINRNKIKTPQGANWLTLPVQSSGKFGQNINDVKITNYDITKRKILSTIKMNYSKTKYFNDYFSEFEDIFNKNEGNLSNLNIDLVLLINRILNINTEIVLSSQLEDIQGDSTERLINICKKMNCSIYFSGFGGSKYQDEDLFVENNIKLRKTDFIHPIYPQLWGEFIPNLSVIDLIFNCGSESQNILGN
ncbi:MAG: WbqC family protein [Ignavibacteriaceae bacterium]